MITNSASGFILLLILRSTVSIPFEQFYPFGDGISSRVPSGDDNFSPLISLQKEFRFFNQPHTTLHVNTNGAISFQNAVSQFTPDPFPLDGNRMLIAAFWGDVDTRGTGIVWYHGSTDPTVLNRASNDIRNAFPIQAAAGFTATDVFIATWDRVGYFREHTDLTNTFQCTLVTDGLQSFVIFLYADGLIQWTTGDASDGVNGLGGTPAQVGFNAGDGVNFAAVPESRTGEIINIDTTSNVGVPGVWVFQVNQETITISSACMFMGAQYQEGEQIQPNCSTRCTCQQEQFQCEQQTCFADGPTCYASGDPHYQTFDLRYYDFQGDCEYILTTPCNSSEFTVIVGNSAHNSYVSCTETVRVLVPGENLEIQLGRGNGGTVTINGNFQPNSGDGIILQSSAVEIIRTGGHPHVLLLTYGVRIFWDGLFRVEVTVSQMWENELCGLCGNFNNDAADDFETPSGSLALTENAFGSSWLYANTSSGCTGLIVPPTCSNDVMTEAQTRCEAMSQTVFTSCNGVVDPTEFIENCMFDYCLCNDVDREDCFCDSLATYAAACAAAGVPPPNWRRFHCPLQCPEGKIYQQCGSLCPQTCENIGQSCNSGCAEGCFCPEGHVVINGRCLNSSECLSGCSYKGMMYEEGEQIQPNCSTRCTCRQGQFQCEAQDCFTDGPTCYASGDPHYQTFDRRYFDFQGDCEYVLTTPCNTSEFSVIVGNSLHNSFVSCTANVTVLVPGENLEIVLGRSSGGTVTINGVMQPNSGDTTILQSGGVEVLRSGGRIHVLLTTYGVRIFWDGSFRVEVTVSTMWQNRLCGLCGNYNNNPSDDFMAPNGDFVSTPDAFGNSWLYFTNNTSCGAISVPGPIPNDTMMMGRNRCDVLREGVFTACNAVVDPTPFIDDCVFDFALCNPTDQETCYCNSLATYAAACTAAGATPPNWRRFYCPIQCPPGMIFQQCGILCPQTCGSSTACTGGCAEGCFCPDGQVINSNGLCTDPRQCLGMFGDPHFMVPLQSKEILCYSIQGYPGLAFNLIYNKNFIINAHFVDSMGDKNEATWIGKLAVIPQNENKSHAVIFDAVNQEVIMVGQGSFKASVIQKITFNENGKTSVKFTKGVEKQAGNPSVHVTYIKPQAEFDVSFHKDHLNVVWNLEYDKLSESEGLMGQFMTKNIDIDTQKQILIYPDGRDPIPVNKDTKMTGNFNKPCWKTMNTGIQGEGLIKGNILDYVISNILEDDFAFKSKK